MRPEYSRDDFDLEALEPRLLLSADPLASLLDGGHDDKTELGESVSVALMQTPTVLTVSADSVQADDFLSVQDQPLTPSFEPEQPAVADEVSATTNVATDYVVRVFATKTATDDPAQSAVSQTSISSQTIITAQQVTSLNAANGPPVSALGSGPVTPGLYTNLATFISDTLTDAASNGIGTTITDTYTFTNDLSLGSVFTIKNATVTFNVTVGGTVESPTWSGTVTITAGEITLTLGSIASAAVTDGPDEGDANGLSATYTLSNATVASAGTFSLTLDQVLLSGFNGALTATGSNFTLSYSQVAGLANSDLNFNPVTVDLNAGAEGSSSNVINASGSGLIQITSTGVAAAIDLTLTQGPNFAGQSISLTGTFKLRLNTTGSAVTSIGGTTVDLPSPGGATYVKVLVENASLVISGATLSADLLTFEKSGDVITVAGVNTAFVLKAGTSQIVKASSNAFAMQFSGSGFAAAVIGAAVEGPSFAGFTVTGVVDFLVNTTGASVNLPGIPNALPGISGDVYVLATVRGVTASAKAALTISQSFIEATTFTFEKNAAGVAFSGDGLSVELRAGAKRIVGVSGASVAFQFVQDGFYGAILNASVTGPDFFNGSTPLFAIAGVVSLRINSTTTNRSILVGSETIDLSPGTPSQPFVKVTVTSAKLTVVGSTLSADTLTFQQSSGVVDVGGINVGFELQAGSKRIVGVTNATFAMRFSPDGFVGGFRHATVTGPDFGSTFTLTGTVDLDINTTGATVVLDGVGAVTGVASSTYIKASVTDAVLTVAGSTLSATTLTFEKSGADVAVAGSGLAFSLKAGSGAEAKKIVGVTVSSFGFVFTEAGFVGAVRDAEVSGPELAGFTLEGSVDLDLNTTGAAYDLPGFGSISGGSDGIYIRASVTDAELVVSGNSLFATTLVFEKSGDDVAVNGTELGFELKAGTGATAKRIVGVTVASFGFVFNKDGMVASIRGGQVNGPEFAGFTLTGNISLDINTTGATYTFVGGALDGVQVTGVAGDTYLRAKVTGDPDIPGDKATLAIPGATIAVASFEFEKSGDNVSVTGAGLLFELKAGATRIVKVEVASFGFIFMETGMVASVRDGTVTGPDFTGFTLTGTVSLDINTTGASYTFVGGALDSVEVPGVAGDTYLRVKVTGDPDIPGDKATLAIPGATIAVSSFEFEKSDIGVSVTGAGLLFELKAGATRIVKVEVASFGFVFMETGMVASVRDGTVTGPDFTGFTLTGTVSLDINTTGANYTFVGGALDGVQVPGVAGDTYLRVKVTGDPDIPGDKATLAIPGATLAVSSFEFEKSESGVSVTGAGLLFELKAGSTRIVKVEVVSFGFVFTEAGMVATVRDGTVSGPDLSGFTLTGTVSLDINTTGASYTFGAGPLNGVTIPGVEGGTYLKVTVSGDPGVPNSRAVLGVMGSELSAEHFYFESDGSTVSLGGTSVTLRLVVGGKRIIGISDATFGFVFAQSGFYGAMRNATIEGPDFGGITLAGKVSFDVNTTGDEQSVTLGGGLGTVTLPGGGTYVRVELAKIDDSTPATLAVGSVSLQVDKFVFEKSGDNVAVQVVNLVFKLGTQFTLTGSADLLFTPTEFRVNNAVLTANAITVGSFLDIISPQVELENFVVTSAGEISGTISIRAVSATIFPGKSYTASITDRANDQAYPGNPTLFDSDDWGLDGTFNVGTGQFALTIDQFNLALGTVLTAKAYNVQIQYDPDGTYPQTLLTIANATVDVPRFDVTGTVNQLEIREDGFKFDSLSISRTSTFNLFGIVEFANLTFTITDFEVIYASGINFTGTITISSSSIKVLPGKPFTATATGATGTLDFSDGKDGALTLTVQSFTLNLGSALTASATGVTINTAPGAGEYVASFVSLSASVNVINITGTLGYTGSDTSYNTPTFAFGADGTFYTFENFGFKLAIGGAAGATGFSWPTWLPIQISTVEITWDNINAHPEEFVLTLSAQITGLHGLAGLSFSGAVENLQIDIGKLLHGEFPIVGLGSVSAQVSGNMFGGQVSAGFFIEILDLQRPDSSSPWAAYTGDPTSGYQTRSVIFAGLDGSMTFASLAVQVRVGLSELGPLSAFIRADVPIVLDPNTGLTLDGLRGGVQFFTTLTTPDGALDLRGKAYSPPGDKTLAQWRSELRVAVVSQTNAGGSFLASMFTEPMLITAGATLYSQYTSKFTFRAEVDLVIDTSGKILINAAAVFGNTLSVRSWFFADLTKVRTGKAKFVFLVDMPEKVGPINPLYSIGGTMEFKFVQFTNRTENFGSITGPGPHTVTLAHEIRTLSTLTVTVGGTTASLSDFTTNQGAQTVTYNGPLTGDLVVSYESVDQLASPTALSDPDAPAPTVAFQVVITGIARLQMPVGGLYAQMSGEIVMTFSPTEFRVRVAAQLEMSFVGQLGLAGGEFVIRKGDGGGTEVFGALQLQTGESLNTFLEPKGLYINAAARIAINTTSQDQPVSLRMPLPGTTPPYGNSELTSDSIVIRAGSFSIIISGAGELRVPGSNTRLLGIEAAFAMEVSSEGLDILAVGKISVGPAGAAIMEFDANALLVVRVGDGIAARMSLTVSAGGAAIGGVSMSAYFHLVLNTTGHTVTYTIPNFSPAIPTVTGPNPADLTGAAISYEIVNGTTRQLVVPSGPPPANLTDPRTWTVAEGGSGPYVVIFGGGTINLLDTFAMTGGFRFEISNTLATGFVLDLRLNMSLTIDPVGTANVVGMMRVTKAGLLASLELEVTGGTSSKGGFSMTGRFWLELNTTESPGLVDRLALDANGNAIPGVVTPTPIAAETVRVFIGATINLGGFAQGSGEVLVVADLGSGDSLIYLNVSLRLKAGGTNLLTFDAQGLLAVTSTGFAGRLNLTLSTQSVPGLNFSANFHLIVNTMGTAVTFDVLTNMAIFMGPDPANPAGAPISYEIAGGTTGRQVKIPQGAPPAGSASYVDWTSSAGDYFVVIGGGTIGIANNTITLTGGFRIVVSTTTVEVALSMSAVLGPLGTASVEGGFVLSSAGIVAGLNVNIASLGVPGFTLSATFNLEINTTGSPGSVPRFNYTSGGTVLAGTSQQSIAAHTIRVFAAGNVDIYGVVTGSGTFSLVISPGLVEIDASITLSLLDVIDASVTFAARATSSGFVMYANFNVDASLTVIPGLSFGLKGAALLEVNTTSSSVTLAGHPAIVPGVRLAVSASINLAGVITVGGGITFIFNQGGSWGVYIPDPAHANSSTVPSGALTADFFGLATINVWGFFNSAGEFAVHVRGSISLGGGGTGLFGSVTFDASYLKQPDQTYVLNLSASISGSAKLFGITLGGFSANFSYASDTGKLSVRVTVTILGISKSKTFTLGYFKLAAPPPFRPAGDLIDGTFWLNGADHLTDGVRGDGILYLNMGSRAGYRSNVDYLTDAGDETFLIRHVSGSPDDVNGETIEIIGMGRKATYSGVKKIILLDTGSGENVVILGSDGPTSVDGVDIGSANYVLSPFYANGGSGEDLFVYYSTGNRQLGSFRLTSGGDPVTYTYNAVINGNGGDDYIEIGSLVGGTVSLSGGGGNDYIIHHGTGAATISGGDGDDDLFGSTNDDTINGDAGSDRIVGGLGVDHINAGAGNDQIYWAPGDGADQINGGGDADTLLFIATNGDDTITLTSLGSSAATLVYVNAAAESVTLSLSNVETVDAHLGQGANTAVINDLLNSGITTLELRVAALVPTIDALLSGDALPTTSVVAPDLFRFTGSSRDDEYVAITESGVVKVTQKNAGTNVVVATLHGTTRPGTANDDVLELHGANGSDTLNAQGITANLIAVKLFGEAGSDRLIGTPFIDFLAGGAGNDTYTGGASVDIFSDTDGGNTLIEVFDRDMSLFNNLFVSGTLNGFSRYGVTDAAGNPVDANRPTGPNGLLANYSDSYAAGAEIEDLASGGSPIFSHAILVGGAGNNVITVGTSTGSLTVGGVVHAVTPWTGEATLDNRSNGGAGQNGYYIVHLNGAAGATINVADSAVSEVDLQGVSHLDPGSSGYDELYVVGTTGADRITLRAGSGHVAETDARGLIYSGDPVNVSTRTTLTYRNLEHVTVRTLGGDDQIDAERTVVATVIEAGDGNDAITLGAADAVTNYSSYQRWAAVVIDAGAGTDSITIGTPASATANTVNTILGHVLVRGGANSDTLTINDFGDSAANTGHLTSTDLTGLGMGSFGVTYSALEVLVINLGTGSDTFSISSTHAGSTTVNANGGSDLIVVGSTAATTPGVLDNIAGTLVLNGDGGGLDRLIALDNADTSANRGTLTATTLTGLDMPVGITYGGFEALEVDLGTTGDAFFIETTHLGTTAIDGGAGDDVFRISSIQGTTTITGAAGDDRFVVNVLDSTDDSAIAAGTDEPPHGAETGVNGIGATLNLDGQEGSDRTWIYAASQVYSATHLVSLINVLDTGATGTDRMRIYGSESADSLLVRRNFVAVISATNAAERINYAGQNGGIRLDTRGGDDFVAFDDTGTTFDVYLGLGADRLQVGQMFDSPRVYDRTNYDAAPHPLIAGYLSTVASAEDEITTITTTRGWLSVGTSHTVNVYGGDGNDTMTVYHNSGALFLFGDDGDDTFIIRAFALYGSSVGNPTRELTTLDTGAGSDFVEYAESAPVAVDGGTGFDTVIVIATEFSDRLVITSDGVTGSGLSISFTGIERLTVYGAEGDDIFIVVSTAAGVEVTVWGGLGSDTFVVGGDPAQAIPTFDLSQIQGPLHIEGGDDPLGDYVISSPLLYLTDSNPDKFVHPVIQTLFDREEDMVDRAFFNDSSNTQGTTGFLNQSRIWGLGMSAGSEINSRIFPAGIVYGGMEMIQVLLGAGNDHFQVDQTHFGSTEILGGAGNDIINVVSVSGHTTLNGEAGDDTFNLGSNHISASDLAGHGTGAPQGLLDRLGAALVVIGGGGTDTLNADDSGDLTSDVAIITGTTLTGLDLRSAIVWTVKLTQGFLGQFSLQVTAGGSTVTTSLLKTKDGAEAMRNALRSALGLDSGSPLLAGIKDVVVDVAGDSFMIVFVTDETVAPAQISLAPTQTDLGIVAERSSLNLLQTITVNATTGSFFLDITDADGVTKQTLSLAWNISTDDLRATLFTAFQSILGAGNVYLRDFLVSKQGSTYFIAYQGQLKGPLGSRLLLRSASPTHTVTSSGADSADLFINASGGTYRIDLGAGRISAPIAYDANAAAVSAAIGHALGSASFTVSALPGGGFRISFAGAGSIRLDARNLVALANVGARTSGISYFGIATLNLDLGSGSDVINVQGTAAGATTNIWANGGDDRVFISSLANETLVTAGTTQFLEGNLDHVLGTLNLSLGNGRHKLMISDEAALTGDGTAENRAKIADQSQFANPTSSEIWITGLAPAGISYGASATGNLADGVTLWTGWGADYLLVDGAHQRTGVRTTTSINTGLGNDNAVVTLNSADGHFVLNAQGPYNEYLAYADDDTIDGSSSTHSLILFGGQGADTLKGGSADDLIFGDRGSVNYVNGAVVVAHYGNGGPGDFTDGVERFIAVAETTDATVGGVDSVDAGAGADVVFGGQASDVLRGDAGNDLLLGDLGTVSFDTAVSTLVPLPATLFDRIVSVTPGATQTLRAIGGSDTLYGGDGDDVLIGSIGNDRLDGGIGQDLIFGDNATLDRSVTRGQMISADPRYRTLIGGVLYDLQTGAPSAGAIAFNNPNGTNAWSDFVIILLDHSMDIEANRADLFGADYIAGGAGRDMIFGGLGNDTIQGDGAIDYVSALYRVDPVTGLLVLATTNVPTNIPAGTDVGAWRGADGLLYVRASFEDAADGDDYIEGNGGNDTIFGGLGQDDIVGGSSTFFGLTDSDSTVSRTLRPDGADLIFGGAGTRIGRGDTGQTSSEAHSRDSDMILADNGNIYRAVGTNGQPLGFGYDNYGTLKIAPRVAELLDYTPGGLDVDATATALNIGAGDEVHGEGGDDFIYGMLGDDVLYGDGQDDDLIGGTGADWISGGAGQDGILGDDGRLWTSRNGTAEPMYGIGAVPVGGLDAFISTAGKVQQATINVSGVLKKTALVEPFNLGADDYVTPGVQSSNDILFGGLGNDWVHGGAGDDAISGAEALPEYFARPLNTGNYLGWGLVRTGEFAAYDEYNPMMKVYVVKNADGIYVFADRTDTGAVQFILNFLDSEDDGNDDLFGDLGNDWVVGGRGRDHLYGGWGDDLLNADDLQDTNGGLNNAPDTSTTYEDLAYGGAGRDILIGNTGGDRLIDWAGEYNSFLVPFAPFGLGTVSRALQPQIAEFLYALSGSDGADTTRSVKTGASAARRGEPFGELGLVLQQDFAWHAQTGAPDDPQPGNIPGGARDVLRSATFDKGTPDGFFIDSGTWNAKSGRVEVAPSMLGSDAVAIFHVGDALPIYYELRVTMNAVKPLAGYKANAYLIFDYQSATDFKFVGLNASTNKMEMGHRTAAGWIVDVQSPIQVKAGQDFNMTLAINGTTATLVVNNQNVFSYAYAPRVVDGVSYGLNGGMVGIGADNAKVSFDNFSVQVLPPNLTLTCLETFNDGVDDLLGAVSTGTWSIVGGRLVLSPISANETVLRTADLQVGTNFVYQLQTRISTAGLAGVVFDYYAPNDYKFAAINVATKQVVIGHVASKGLVIDATIARTALSSTGTYLLDVSLKGTTVSVSIDGNQVLGYVFNAPVVDGQAGVFARAVTASFDSYQYRTSDPQFATALSGSFLNAAYAPLADAPVATLTAVELRSAVDSVIAWFARNGSTAEELAILRTTPVTITDLAGLALGWTDGFGVSVDVNAAGHGWITTTRGLAAGGTTTGMDLRSVVAHEFAHVLGSGHVVASGSPSFMNELLPPNTQLLPGSVALLDTADAAIGLRYAAAHSADAAVLGGNGLSGSPALAGPAGVAVLVDIAPAELPGFRALSRKI